MYAIAQAARQYLTYVVTDPTQQTSLEVVPERGGIITCWRVNDEDIFYLDEERFTDPTLSVRGGNPILFPICGNLLDNTYTHAGKSYSLKQHGFARDLPWTVVDQQASADSAQITLGLSSTDFTRTLYPFEFDLAFTYILREKSLTIQQRYTNRSAIPMPFSAGFHPYFTVTDKTQLQWHIPASHYDDNVSKSVQAYSGQFDVSLPEIDAAFTELSSRVAMVDDLGRSRRLTFTMSPEFSTLVFWTLQGKDFYCLEPWTAPRNALNTGDRLIQLPPGESITLEFSLAVDPLP